MTTSLQKDALLSEFAVLAYKDKAFLENSVNLPAGWVLKADDVRPPFAAFAFKNDTTGEVIIAYRGTDGLGDLGGDAGILSGTWSSQFQQGMNFAKAVLENRDIIPADFDQTNLLTTGHSLGGAIAQIIAQAYGLDGSAIDPGAAVRIAQTPEFQAAALAAGLPPTGLGAAASFTNYLVVGSIVSGGTGEHIGHTSYVPSLTFNTEQSLTSFLIGLVNPAAGFAYAIGTDQFTDKHSSTQISQAIQLMAGASDAGSLDAGVIKLTPKITGWQTDNVTGESVPVYSQSEFEIHNAEGDLQSTVKFTGSGATRQFEVFDTTGALQSTTTLAVSGAVTVRPVHGDSLEVTWLPDSPQNPNGEVLATQRSSEGDITLITTTDETGTYTYDFNELTAGQCTAAGFYAVDDVDAILTQLGIPAPTWSNFLFLPSGEQTFLWDSDGASFQLNTSSPWFTQGNGALGSGFSYTIDPAFNSAIATLGGAMNHVSPLVLDLDGDGVATDLTHAYGSQVFFDIDNDQFAERVGWVNADDGLLARDNNGNGQIDDISELYGDDEMPAFDKLRLLDVNHDNRIDANDSAYSQLLVWKDTNQNGVSEADELHTLASLNIASLATNDHNQATWANENYLSSSATFTYADGTTRELSDVHFLNDNINTWYLGAHSQVFDSQITIDLAAVMMPLSRGYGSLPSLHIALSQNPELMQLMRQLVALTPANIDSAAQLVNDLLLEWAGVQDNDPFARATGENNAVDARRVDFIEQFTGVTWAQRGTSTMVGEDASIGLKRTWQNIHALMLDRLLVQGALKALFPDASYDFAQDKLTLGSDLTGIVTRAGDYAAQITASQTQKDFWLELGDILLRHRSELGQSLAQIDSTLSAAAGFPLYLGEKTLTAADGVFYTGQDGANETLSAHTYLGDANANVIHGGNSPASVFAGAGNDTITTGDQDDLILAGEGDDQIQAGAGFNRIEAGDGVDTITSGSDGDIIYGGAGIDRIDAGAGADMIDGGAGSDHLNGGAGIDTATYHSNTRGMVVNLATGQAAGGEANGDTLTAFENLTGSFYSDVLIGNDQDNSLNGEMGADRLFGGAGRDSLFGGLGKNALFGEAGDDVLYAFTHAESFDGGSGIDTLSYGHPYLASGSTLATSGVVVSLRVGRGQGGPAEGDTYHDIENITGTYRLADVLIGDDQANMIYGNQGLDVLLGEGGNDVLIAVSGGEHLFGGWGWDHFGVIDKDSPFFGRVGYATPSASAAPGSDASDTPALAWSDPRIVIHDFDASSLERISLYYLKITRLQLLQCAQGTIIPLTDGRELLILGITPTQLNLSHFILPDGVSELERGVYTPAPGLTLSGSDADNQLSGSSSNDTLQGQAGRDVLVGGDGVDVLHGGADNDVLIGGAEADVIDGGSGVDETRYDDSWAGVNVDLQSGVAHGGSAEGDTLTGIETIAGSNFDDSLRGSDAIDVAETLEGLNGNDTLAGGDGANVLTGGGGADRFVITAHQAGGVGTATTVITDFALDNPDEKIDLSAVNLAGQRLVAEWSADYRELSFYTGNGVAGTDTLYKGVLTLKNLDFNLTDPAVYKLPDLNRLFTFGAGQAPSGFEVRAPTQNWLIGSDGSDVLQGSGVTYVPWGGDDVIEKQYDHGDGFSIGLQPGQTLRIKNFENKVETFSFYHQPQNNYTPLRTDDYRNTWFDFHQNPNLMSFNDLVISELQSGPVTGTQLDLGEGQKIILDAWFQSSGSRWLAPMTQYGYIFTGLESQGAGNVRIEYDSALSNAHFNWYTGALDGSLGDDHLTGGKYADVIKGGNGDDMLDGRGANDVMSGGDGFDIFIVGRDPGTSDRITDFEFWKHGDRIDLSAFTEIADFVALRARASFDGQHTTIDLGAGQTLVLEGLAPDQLSPVSFIGNASINSAPVMTQTLADQTARADSLFSLTLPANLFTDADHETLAWTITREDGAPLPAWLTYDAATRTLSGTPAHGDTGNLRINVSAGDNAEARAGGVFSVNVLPPNSAPTLLHAMGNPVADEDTAFSFTVPADAFADVDVAAGDALAYSARRADGSALPAWLSFDAATRTFSGTPQNDDVGSLALQVTATDSYGASVDSTFDLVVANTNDAPVVVPVAAVTYDETQVNTFTTHQQQFPSVAALADGGWLVTWQSNSQDGSNAGIYAQRYASSGAAIGGETHVSTFTENAQSYPSVAALADGGWLVTWQSMAQDGAGYGIYAQRYAASGAALGGETQVNTFTPESQRSPAVTALADGGWVVVWGSYAQDGSDDGIYAQRYASNGATAGGETRVNTFTAGYQYNPSVSALADGGWIVTWLSYGQDGADYDIYAQRYAASSATVGSETRVNTFTAGNQLNPSVTALADGGWVVAWHSDGQDGSSTGVYAQRYTVSGAALGGELRVNTVTESFQDNPAITALADGGWVVSWQSYAQDGSSTGVYAQRYAASGAVVGGETQVNTFTAGNQYFSAVTALADGGYVVTWQSVNQDGSSDGVYSQRFAADGTRTAHASSVTLSEDTASAATAIGATDVDGDALSYRLKPGFAPQKGMVVFDTAVGSYVYTPNADQNGADAFTILVEDGHGGAAERAVAVDIAPVDDVLAVHAALADRTVAEDAPFSFILPADAFADVDAPADYLLHYSATLANGDALPAWLSFDVATRTFSGTPGNAQVGVLSIAVKATDAGGLSVADIFDLTVANTNDAPILLNAPPRQMTIPENTTFSYYLADDTFSDADLGDHLLYSAALANGDPLPDWLSFNPVTRSFSGSPGVGNLVELELRIRATDLAGASAEAAVRLSVVAAPSVQLTGNTWDDILLGYSNADTIDGGAGNDTIDGGAGSDIVNGGSGIDSVLGGDGDDILQVSADKNWQPDFVAFNAGSPGHVGTGERVSITGQVGSFDYFDGGNGQDTLQGTSGNDGLFLDDGYSPMPGAMRGRIANVETIDGGDGNDVIDLTSDRFGYGDVTLKGGKGDDILWASAGKDTLEGGDGNDRLAGGAGDDTLNGGSGNNTLNGGTGSDTYLVNLGDGNDVIQETVGVPGEENTDVDTLRFGPGIDPYKLWMERMEDSLRLLVINTQQQVTVSNWWGQPGDVRPIEQIEMSDGMLLIAKKVDLLYQAMAGFAPPSSATTSLPQSTVDALAPIIAASWTPGEPGK